MKTVVSEVPNKRTIKQIQDFKKKNEQTVSKKREIVKINKEIAQHAQRKELQEAVELFNDAKSRGLVNSHTVLIILHTFHRFRLLVK